MPNTSARFFTVNSLSKKKFHSVWFFGTAGVITTKVFSVFLKLSVIKFILSSKWIFIPLSCNSEVNCVFVKNLIEFCNKRNIKLIHISTDYVYTNSVEDASENDVPVHCDNWYGYTKLLGDGLVQLLSKDYLVIRCTHKPTPFPYEKAWINQTGNFDYVDVISDLIIKSINKNLNGVYNIGTEKKTIFDLGLKTKEVTPTYAPDYVPKNTTMNLDKIKNELND